MAPFLRDHLKMGRAKQRKLTRSRATAKPVRRFYLVTEGRNTEPNYFHSLQELVGKTQIKIVIEPGAGDPRRIAERAMEIMHENGLSQKSRKKLGSFEENDEVWAVFDRDTFDHYDVAKETCVANGVGVAYSDPCFELWLILHFCGHDGPCSSEDAQRRCQQVLDGYNRKKSKMADFLPVISNLEAAETRAERQQTAREREGSLEGNPSTSVYRLTRDIRKSAKESTRK